jgi:hypothetical protein
VPAKPKRKARSKSLIRHPLEVRFHPSTYISDPEVDVILDSANVRIFYVANVRLFRSGPVQQYSGPGVINSQQDFDQVFAAQTKGVPRRARVVYQINWCGTVGAGIIGCADTPGLRMAVVRFTGTLEDVLWGHEFSHTKGNPHRASTTALMNPTICSTCLGLDASEISRLRQLQKIQRGLRVEPDRYGRDRVRVDSLILTQYVEGVPFRSFKQSLVEGDEARLNQILSDAQLREFHGNALVALALVPGSGTSSALVSYILHDSSTDVIGRRNRAMAVVGLGYSAAEKNDDAAVTFLVEGSRFDRWNRWGTAWRSNDQARDGAQIEALTMTCILALGLSGRPKALTRLKQLQKEVSSRQSGVALRITPAVEEALRIHVIVEREGLDAYYSRPHVH